MDELGNHGTEVIGESVCAEGGLHVHKLRTGILEDWEDIEIEGRREGLIEVWGIVFGHVEEVGEGVVKWFEHDCSQFGYLAAPTLEEAYSDDVFEELVDRVEAVKD